MSTTTALDAIDPAQDSSKFLHTASNIVNNAAQKKKLPDNFKPLQSDWNRIASGLARVHGDFVHTHGTEWSSLMAFLASTCTLAANNQDAAVAVAALSKALLRLDPTSGTLTTHHISLVRAGLKTGAYAEAKPVLDNEIHSFPAEDSDDSALSNGHVTIKSGATQAVDLHLVQEYYLGGAMIYIGLQNWSRAQHFLEQVLCTPTYGGGSGPMLDAYRKWVLVGLLAGGRTPFLPRATNQSATRQVRNLSKQYDAVAEAFASGDPRKIQAEIVEAEQDFRRYGDYGLVLNVLQQHRLRAVTRLNKTFTAVPMSLVAAKLSIAPAAAASYVQQLVREGHLPGRLEQSDAGPLIRFDVEGIKTATEADERRLQQALTGQAERIRLLASHIEEADRKLSLTQEFTESTKKKRQNKAAKPEGAASKAGPPTALDDDEPMDVSFQETRSDEDDETEMTDAR